MLYQTELRTPEGAAAGFEPATLAGLARRDTRLGLKLGRDGETRTPKALPHRFPKPDCFRLQTYAPT